MLPFVERLRAVCDEYGAIHTVAEIGGDNAIEERRAYALSSKRLDSCYGFDFLYCAELTPEFVVGALEGWDESTSWPTWAFENHDAPRAVSRWCAAEDMAPFARLKAALLLALRGNVILYQGEELGVEQDDIPFALLKDPEAIANWPLTLSRDGARTPMPWENEPLGGFTTVAPWLPLSAANTARAVMVQEGDPDSLLNYTRALLALRKGHAALRLGSLTNLEADGPLLRFERILEGERVACVFNLSPRSVTLRQEEPGQALLGVNGATHDVLPPYGALWLAL
jgi:alpha-glucosidase